MRSRSSVNFTDSDLKEIVSICKTNKVKTYLTINIVIYDEEIERMQQLVDLAATVGVDAIIASDQSVIAYARSKNVEIHLSTQINISNKEALKFYAGFADVVVLARELNMDQVHHIHKAIEEENICGPNGDPIKIEMFCHGALCMSVSGKCYLSLHEYNYSANRGACLQTCRRAYDVTDKETGRQLVVDNEYIMSPKDLCTIHFMNKMIDAGVRVFKIEGRARPAEYVKIVTQSYSEALNAVLDGSYNAEKIQKWQTNLNKVFNRGFWDGYYLGQRLGEWSHKYGSKATRKKVYVGKGTNYFPKIGVAELLLEAGNLKVGDEILVTGPTTGVIETKVEEIRLDLKPVDAAQQGNAISIPLKEKIRRNDKVYKWEIVENENISLLQ